MRTGALALLMLIAACGQPGPEPNQTGGSGSGAAGEAPPDQRATAATVTLSASGPGNCAARLDGQPATARQLFERSGTAVEQAIERAGNVTSLTDETMPALAVAAPAGLAFACVDTFLAPIFRAGVPTVLLSVEGGGEAALVDFTLSDIGAPPPTVVIAIAGGGRLTWNGQAIAMAALTERLRQLGGAAEAGIEAPRGELELRPSREATFGQVHAVLRAVRSGRFRAALLLPSVQPTRLPAPATPPPSNQAAPANQSPARP